MGLAPVFAAFLNGLIGKITAEGLVRLESAWELAQHAHSGQVRSSGEPYASHPLAVAQILQDLFDPGVDALCAALLHDVVEDSDVSLAEIESRFGSDVSLIVDGVSKLDAVQFDCARTAKDETLRKLVSAGGRDWRVFAVKLSDRLHNMRTLGAVSAGKSRRVALETQQVLFPLARYMGFHTLANELEALCLRALHPWRWGVIGRWVEYRLGVDIRRSYRICDANFTSADFSRSARCNDVHDRLVVQAFHSLSRDRAVHALFGVPTLTLHSASIQDAYARVSALHSRFVFVPGSFNSDASEGYVTTKILLSRRGPVVEFIARFPRVLREAWTRHDEDATNVGDFAVLANLQQPAGEFTRVLRDLVAEKSIVVFSPKGLRVSLPRGSSGLDFAFAIHTDLGLRTSCVLVNGVRRDASSELTSGDVVEVISGEVEVARADWEPLLKSPRSRAKLRQWLRDTARVGSIELGRRLLVDAFSLAGIAGPLTTVVDARLLASYAAASLDALLQRIGEGAVSAESVVAFASNPQFARIVGQSIKGNGLRSLILDGDRVAGIRYCDLCCPLPGDSIVCLLSQEGAVVHRDGCVARRDRRTYAEEFAPIWAPRLVVALPCVLKVVALDRRGLLADCARAISECGVSLTAVSSRSFQKLGQAAAELVFHLEIFDSHALGVCVATLSAVLGVQTVVRAESGQTAD